MAASKKPQIEIVRMKPTVRSVWESIGLTKKQVIVICILLFIGFCGFIFSSVDFSNHSEEIEWEFKELESAPAVTVDVAPTVQSSSVNVTTTDPFSQVVESMMGWLIPLTVGFVIFGSVAKVYFK